MGTDTPSADGGEAVVVVTEALTRPALPGWRAMLDRVVGTRPKRLVLDLSQTPNIDADGIAALLEVHRGLVSTGGELVVRAPNARVRRLFGLARLSGVLTLEPEPPATRAMEARR